MRVIANFLPFLHLTVFLPIEKVEIGRNILNLKLNKVLFAMLIYSWRCGNDKDNFERNLGSVMVCFLSPLQSCFGLQNGRAGMIDR